MLTQEEESIVRAYIRGIAVSDAFSVIGHNIFALIFVYATMITSIWFYVIWFVLLAFTTSGVGLWVSRINIPDLEWDGRSPVEILTPKRCAALVLLLLAITSCTYCTVLVASRVQS